MNTQFSPQIHDYSRLLQEIARLLRPGGLVLLIEPDLVPRVDGKSVVRCPDGSGDSGLHGWLTFWETYRACLKSRGIDSTVPQRLVDLVSATDAFENIVTQDCDVPVGFWPTGECTVPNLLHLRVYMVGVDSHLLTIGQLQWMDYELFLPAVKPLFLSAGLSESKVERIVADAQHDLYYPCASISTHLHIVYASKCL
jgi:SAM-dependent methyltransferase